MATNLTRTLLAAVLVFALCATACKKRDNKPEPDKLTVLKQQVSGEWEITSGVYREYDQEGKIWYTENLPFENPAPWYDLRKADILYVNDRHGREGLAYTVFIADDGTAHIKIAASSWDISRTYQLKITGAGQMSWIQDQRFPNEGPNTLSRVYTQYDFTKR